MSIETTCSNCGAEYDIRHGDCPACTVRIQMRSARPPYDTWTDVGHLPFEVHGEKFAVTRISMTMRHSHWRATHIATGVGVPGSECVEMKDVPAQTKALLKQIGPAKLQDALKRARAHFAKGKGTKP